MNIALLGPQGCGKGTQAEKLEQEFGLVRVETGRILRQIGDSNQPNAEIIKKMMLEGKLVSDDILAEVIKNKLELQPGKGYVFDGTPRDLKQYEMLNRLLMSMGHKLDKIVFLNISEEESVVRLSNRRTCESCNKIYNLLTDKPPVPDTCECGGKLIQRDDDVPDAIRKRLEAYRDATLPVIAQARKEGILVEIDGSRTIEEVHKEIIEKLKL